MANLNLSQFTTKTLVEDADWVFVWDTAGAISKKVSRNSLLSVGSIATSTPVTISQTWTDAAVAFAAMKIVATDTNSLATSDFLELYSGTSTQPLRLDIQKTGQVNIYGTWTNSTTYERLSLSAPTAANAIIGTNRSGGTARGLDFHTEGTARMTIGTNGNVGIGTTAPRTKLHLEDTASIPLVEFSGATVANFTGVGFSPSIATNTCARIGPASTTSGGLILSGFTSSSNIHPPLIFAGYNGSTAPTTSCIAFASWKHNGSTGRVVLADAEISSQWSNGTTPLITLLGGGNLGIGTTAPSSKLEVVGAVTVSTYIKVSPVAVTSLPDAATAGVGARAFVNDALVPVFGSAVANGGSAKVPVYSDGSAWYVG